MKTRVKAEKQPKQLSNAKRRAAIRAIDAKLAEDNYNGWCGTADFLCLKYPDLINYLKGLLLISIGSGDLDNALRSTFQQYAAWDARNTKRRELVRKAGLQDWV